MHTTNFFPDCYLLSVNDGSISIPNLARYSRSPIFKQMEVNVHLENAFPGGIGNRRITFGYNLWFASHPSACHVTPVAGPIFGPLSTRSIDRFHFDECLICRFYFVPNPSNLLNPVVLCARIFHKLNRAISFRRIQILLSSFWKRDRERVFYKCSNSGQNSFVIENLFRQDYLD